MQPIAHGCCLCRRRRQAGRSPRHARAELQQRPGRAGRRPGGAANGLRQAQPSVQVWN